MNHIRVVLIEDHDLTRMALKTALQERSEVDCIGEATKGKEGLQLVQNLVPDVAIVDIGLPDLDGIELTRQLKATPIATKILILTLQDNEEAVMTAFAAGADSYCMKDTKLEWLLDAIKTTHQGNAWIDPAIARIVLSCARNSNSVRSHFASHSASNSSRTENYYLTERELEVLQLIVEGYSNAEIAKALYITVGTVKTHVRNILNKLCANDRTQAAVQALRSGIVKL
ncbi:MULTISPECIES: response regulator transcription factor [Spirulina sp. CCY15215]|uniref:response regulator n=1 Tax=Spirulina sp. CCY15215 TaxID=2767591 RepID=UPI0019508062|nr:response regulator transcription factor [Spirulina major]